MTDHSSISRVPDGTERAAMVRTESRPDGSTVLVVLTPGRPMVLVEHRFFLDRYLTWALLHTLDRDLDGVPHPGPTPEAAALLDALRARDKDAFSAAMDNYSFRVISLWTDGGAAA
ncbi:hypothetical protein [Streptomyces scabiei]|uniref:hypothetical protein n=1 Tax=Streptomyces scabiei TaxID=1930 RepID=UPI0029B30F67|nr:hypothetical protein [Streptomyces scabiei]MDX3519877.1 hypothetical protein [Streptomyces scabiei]